MQMFVYLMFPLELPCPRASLIYSWRQVTALPWLVSHPLTSSEGTVHGQLGCNLNGAQRRRVQEQGVGQGIELKIDGPSTFTSMCTWMLTQMYCLLGLTHHHVGQSADECIKSPVSRVKATAPCNCVLSWPKSH